MAVDVTITKAQMIRLLENYREERESISQILRHLSQDIEGFYQPSSQGSIDEAGVKVQKQFDQEKQIEQLLAKCDAARQYQRKTLLELRDRTELLDRLIFCLARLPGDMRALIIATMIEGETLEAYAERKGIGKSTVLRSKDSSLGILYEKFSKRKIEIDKKSKE